MQVIFSRQCHFISSNWKGFWLISTQQETIIIFTNIYLARFVYFCLISLFLQQHKYIYIRVCMCYFDISNYYFRDIKFLESKVWKSHISSTIIQLTRIWNWKINELFAPAKFMIGIFLKSSIIPYNRGVDDYVKKGMGSTDQKEGRLPPIYATVP